MYYRVILSGRNKYFEKLLQHPFPINLFYMLQESRAIKPSECKINYSTWCKPNCPFCWHEHVKLSVFAYHKRCIIIHIAAVGVVMWAAGSLYVSINNGAALEL